MANDTEFGLTSYVYTRDIGRVWRVAEGIEYGMVGVNETAITNEVILFGGVKESGQGREGSKYGAEIAQLVECFLVSGGYDYLVHFLCKSLDKISSIIFLGQTLYRLRVQ